MLARRRDVLRLLVSGGIASEATCRARASAAVAWLEVEYVQIDDRTMRAAEVLRDGAMFDRPA
jgi:hypothetical protein